MEEEKKAKSAVIRHKGRKYPQIAIVFLDNSEKAITIRADTKTAEKVLFKIKREIALGKFTIDRYIGDHEDGVTMSEFQDHFLEHREKLVHIGPFATLTGKGKKSRNMPLCTEACQLLDRRARYLEDPDKQFEIMDRRKVPSQDPDIVISRLKQGFIIREITDIHSITKAFGRARRALGLAYFNAHSLRHSFATYCLKDDIPITTVKEFLGHRDISMTMIYAKTDEEVKAKNIKKMKAR